MTVTWFICLLGAYLVGSIPFGVLIARSKGVDIRAHGSKNIGATNVGRVLGRRFGITCFVLDMLKGALPVLIGGAILEWLGQPVHTLAALELTLWLLIAAAAVLGHIFSIYLRFAGGKGVATAFGALVAVWPMLTLPVLGALLVWIATVAITRMISLASVIAACSVPVLVWVNLIVLHNLDMGESLRTGAPALVLTGLLALLVVVRHRTNLARIVKGTEPRLGSPVESPPDNLPDQLGNEDDEG